MSCFTSKSSSHNETTLCKNEKKVSGCAGMICPEKKKKKGLVERHICCLGSEVPDLKLSWCYICFFSHMKYSWASKNQEHLVDTLQAACCHRPLLCKLEQRWQTPQRYLSACWFCLPRKANWLLWLVLNRLTIVLGFVHEQCRAFFTKIAGTFLHRVLPCIQAVTEPKPSSLTDTRLAYAALIPDHLFLKLHNSLSWSTPAFQILGVGD